MKAKTIDVNEISKVLAYSEESPSGLVWTSTLGRRAVAGKPAGYLDKGERWRVGLMGRSYEVSRLIVELSGTHLDAGDKVDHIDGNPANNRLNNLRVVSQKVNCRNKRKRSDNTSGYTGITKITNKCGNVYWIASFTSFDGFTEYKPFRIKDDEGIALLDAVAWRDKKLEGDLTYTTRHGK